MRCTSQLTAVTSSEATGEHTRQESNRQVGHGSAEVRPDSFRDFNKILTLRESFQDDNISGRMVLQSHKSDLCDSNNVLGQRGGSATQVKLLVRVWTARGGPRGQPTS